MEDFGYHMVVMCINTLILGRCICIYLGMPSRFIAQILEHVVNHESYSFKSLSEIYVGFCDAVRSLHSGSSRRFCWFVQSKTCKFMW